MTSPRQWLDSLESALDARRLKLQIYEDYFSGKHRLAFATSRFREAFGNLFGEFADNWCPLVVRAPVERLKVTGFRFGEPAADASAWSLWQHNGLDRKARQIHTEAVKLGISYTLVSPGPGEPRITCEHPYQMIVAHAPGDRESRVAALKKYRDEYEYARATVYLPGGIYRFGSKRPLSETVGGAKVNWQPDGFEANPLGRVPVVPFENDSSMLSGGHSDLDEVIQIQDAINKLVLDMIVASEYGGFPQRWATGIEIPKDPDTGQPISTDWRAAVNRLWSTPKSDANFGEFQVAQLSNYVSGIEMLIQHLAARTRTPPHYLLGQSGAFPSGESLKASETGLVAKVRSKMDDFSEPWEETLRLAFGLKGEDVKAKAMDAETLWQEPESKSQGEITDAAVKMLALQIPFRDIWRFIGATPQEVDRWWTERGAALRANAPDTTSQPPAAP